MTTTVSSKQGAQRELTQPAEHKQQTKPRRSTQETRDIHCTSITLQQHEYSAMETGTTNTNALKRSAETDSVAGGGTEKQEDDVGGHQQWDQQWQWRRRICSQICLVGWLSLSQGLLGDPSCMPRLEQCLENYPSFSSTCPRNHKKPTAPGQNNPSLAYRREASHSKNSRVH